MKPGNINNVFNKASFSQLVLLGTVSIFYLLYNKYDIFTGIMVSTLASFFYIQSIKLSRIHKFIALFGFPLRLLLIAPPSAILVHKLHSNLIALFLGFAISQIILFFFIWIYAKQQSK